MKLSFGMIVVLIMGIAFLIFMHLTDDWNVCNYETYKDFTKTMAYQNNIPISQAHNWCMNVYDNPTMIAGLLFTGISPTLIYFYNKRNTQTQKGSTE